MAIDFTNIIKDKTAYVRKEEYNKLVNAALKAYMDGHRYALRDAMLIKTLFNTARRVSEIIGQKPYTKVHGLRPCDLQNGLIEFCILKKNHINRRNKQGKLRPKALLAEMHFNKEPLKRLIPVPSKYYKDLKKYIISQGMRLDSKQRIFPISRWRVNQIIDKYAHICQIARTTRKHISAHMFRHGYSINFLKCNTGDSSAVKNLQTILQHSSIIVTSTYMQFTPEDIKRSIENAFQ